MKKNILSILFLAITISSFVGCNTKNTTINNQDSNIVSNNENENSSIVNNNENNMSKENLPTSNMSGKLVNYYKTLNEINNDSELVVMGTIIENEYIEYDDLIFTLSKFKINNVIKGELNVGDTIKVLQTGGISEITPNSTDVKSFEDPEEVEKYSNENYGKKYETTIEGVSVLKENDNAILLLKKYVGPIVEDSYVGTGDFQGRFIINSNTKSNTPSVTPQSTFLTETVTFDDLMNLK